MAINKIVLAWIYGQGRAFLANSSPLVRWFPGSLIPWSPDPMANTMASQAKM